MTTTSARGSSLAWTFLHLKKTVLLWVAFILALLGTVLPAPTACAQSEITVTLMGDVTEPQTITALPDTSLMTLLNHPDINPLLPPYYEVKLISGGSVDVLKLPLQKPVMLLHLDVINIVAIDAPPPPPVLEPEPVPVVIDEQPELMDKIEAVVEEPPPQMEAVIDDSMPRVSLQPGDILRINLPEEEGFNTDFLVARDGTITLPEAGRIEVIGLTIEEARRIITEALTTIYLGIDKLEIDIKEQRLLVTVLGYVERPGEVELPNRGNIQTAINAAGGFKDGALISEIKLKRGTQTIDVDFKKYLNTGRDEYLPRLRPLDMLFVPSSPALGDIYGQTAEDAQIDPTKDPSAIKMIGEVTKPGSIAFKENMTAVDALLLAGGVTRYADDVRIRVINDGVPSNFSLADYMKYGDQGERLYLTPGATIYVPIKDETAVLADDPTENPDAIKVFGEVARPGLHQYKEGISLLDLLLLSGGVTRYANVEQVRIISAGEPVMFNLKRFLDGKSSLPAIAPSSTIFVPMQVDAISAGGNFVYVMGQVNKPGSYESTAGVGFLDVLANAGGPNRFADTTAIRVLKANGDVRKFNLNEYTEGKGEPLPRIDIGDAIFLPEKAEVDDQGWLKYGTLETVRLIGAVGKPGRYRYSSTIDFMDLFAYAGGATGDADLANIKFIYPAIRGFAEVLTFNLQEYGDYGSAQVELPPLVGGLTIIIPELPKSPTDNKNNWILLDSQQAIHIIGSVNKPGRYAFNDRLDLLDLLAGADGARDDADLTNIQVVHRSEGESRISHVDLLAYYDSGDESLLPDIKPGDHVYIHSRDASVAGRNNTVTLFGQVATSGPVMFREGLSLIDILAASGGTAQDADLERILIRRAGTNIEVDLLAHLNEPVANPLPPLVAGDVVYVSHEEDSFMSTMRLWFTDISAVVTLLLLVIGL